MTYVMTVNSIRERDFAIARIRRSYEARLIDNPELELIQETVNKIRVYHKTNHVKVLVRTILVVVLPVIINWRPLEDIYDNKVIFDFSHTYEEINRVTTKLKQLREPVKRKPSAATQDLLQALTEFPEGKDA